MSKIRLIGRESYFYGKSLFEIAANLKNCHGRVVARSTRINRYPEKSFYILEDVIPDLKEQKYHRGEAWGYQVFRGKKYPKLKKIETGHKTDWFLVPKEEEAEFCKIDKVYTPCQQIPETLPFPPVFSMVMKRKMEKLRGVDNYVMPEMKVKIRSQEKTFQQQSE